MTKVLLALHYILPGRGIAKRAYSIPRRPNMCYMEETFHAVCRHWGERYNYAPCGAGHATKGAPYGCSNTQINGTRRVNTRCRACVSKSIAEQNKFRVCLPSLALPGLSQEANRQFRSLCHARRLGYQHEFPTFHTRFVGIERRRSVS